MLCAFFLIDLIGRKRSLASGISLQLFAMLYMAIFLLTDKTIADKSKPQTTGQKHAAMGAIVMIYFSGFGWALGWNSIQYLINSEIYPLRLRALGGSFASKFRTMQAVSGKQALISHSSDLPLRQPVRQLQGRAPDVPRHDHRRHYAVLQLRDRPRSLVGVVLPPRDLRKESGVHGRVVQLALVLGWSQGRCAFKGTWWLVRGA
jgi:hypothetical protein